MLWGPSSLLVTGCQSSCPGVTQLGGAVYHSPPFNTEVESEWSYTSAQPICLYALGGDIFTSSEISVVPYVVLNTIYVLL